MNKSAAFLANLLKQQLGPMVLGPAFPPIPRIKNLYMKDLIVKIVKNGTLASIKSCLREATDALQAVPAYRSVTVITDVDPY